MKNILILIGILLSSNFYAQEEVLKLSEFLGYVKKYHPIVKQANLLLTQGEGKLLKARGNFDPKIEGNYQEKEFKGTEYFDQRTAIFKIPTWYGVEFKATYEQNQGTFLNPDLTVPEDGLYSAGVSVSLARNLLINDRMAQLKQAKYYLQQAKAEQQLSVNKTLYKASISYMNWLKLYKSKNVYTTFLENAALRFEAVKKSYVEGDKPAIDTLEASIAVTSRKLALEDISLQMTKARLELSNFLWINDVPVELKENLIPDINTNTIASEALEVNDVFTSNFEIINHPKMQSLNFKVKSLEVEKRLKLNNLLPKVDVSYNFLTPDPLVMNSFESSNYKGGVTISFPLLLRKERGDFKLAKAKLSAAKFDVQTQEVQLQNKFNATTTAINSYNKQLNFVEKIVNDYQRLLVAEERKFEFGDSSLFLINSRESKLITSRLKAIDIENKLLKEKASLLELKVLQ